MSEQEDWELWYDIVKPYFEKYSLPTDEAFVKEFSDDFVEASKQLIRKRKEIYLEKSKSLGENQ